MYCDQVQTNICNICYKCYCTKKENPTGTFGYGDCKLDVCLKDGCLHYVHPSLVERLQCMNKLTQQK